MFYTAIVSIFLIIVLWILYICRFLHRHGGDEHETITKLKYYFAHTINGVSSIIIFATFIFNKEKREEI